MSVIRTGTTKNYASGWDTAFGKGTNKSGKTGGKTAKAVGSKTAVKGSAPKAGKAKAGAAKAGAKSGAVKSKPKAAAKGSSVAKKKPARKVAKQ